MKFDTEYFGGISTNMWIWSGHTSASIIDKSLPMNHSPSEWFSRYNKYPPAKPGVFHRRAKPYATSARVTSRWYGLTLA